jgi:hypothetical protein
VNGATVVRTLLLALTALLLSIALSPRVVLARRPFVWANNEGEVRWFAFASALAISLAVLVASFD